MFLNLEREHALTKDAKKGLESKEDIHGASKGLRVTEKDRTGVGTEKTNPYDGVKEVMFFHIKGWFTLYAKKQQLSIIQKIMQFLVYYILCIKELKIIILL